MSELELSLTRVTRILMNTERIVTRFAEALTPESDDINSGYKRGLKDSSVLPYQKHVLRAAYKLAYVISLLGTDEGPGDELALQYSVISAFQPLSRCEEMEVQPYLASSSDVTVDVESEDAEGEIGEGESVENSSSRSGFLKEWLNRLLRRNSALVESENHELHARAEDERQRDMRLLETFATVITEYAKKLAPESKVGLAGVLKAVDALYPETLEVLDEI